MPPLISLRPLIDAVRQVSGTFIFKLHALEMSKYNQRARMTKHSETFEVYVTTEILGMKAS